MSEYLRLALATVLVLLPGRLVARALGQRSTATTFVWAMTAIFVAWAVVFVVHGTIRLALGVLAAIAVAAWLVGRRRRPSLPAPPSGHGVVLVLGLILGALLWHVAGVVTGDGFFHEARIRKLVDLGDLHLRTVDEFKDGGLHPGYAFPLWHGFDALVAELSGLDPGVVLNHEASVLVPLACLLAWEAGVAVFGSPGGGFAVLAGQLGLSLFAAGHGGSFALLAQPPSAAKLLLVPAAIALFFGYLESRRLSLAFALAAAFGVLELTNAPYGVFALIPLAAYAAVRLGEWRASAIALAAASVPVLLVELWTLPLVREWRSHNPGPAALALGLTHYADELQIWSPHDFRVAPGLIGRSGAVSVAALALIPLAGLASRRRWSAFVLAGSVSILALMLVPALFVRFTDVFSLSFSRRAAGFVPFAFAFAGGLALLARSTLVLPAALAAGIALQLLWPGDFVYGLRHGGPAALTWFAVLGGAVALVVALTSRRRDVPERPDRAGIAAFLFVLPVAVHGFSHWSPLHPTDPGALSPRIVRELRALPPRTVVIGPTETSYRIAADAPVYIVASPVMHVAYTNANRPFARVRDVDHWLATRDPATLRRYGATWAVSHRHLYPLKQRGPHMIARHRSARPHGPPNASNETDH
jgi:hypothetical protein